MIPKNIFTIWLSQKPIPILLEKWINTHKVLGFTHTLFTLDNIPRIPYVDQAVCNKNWVKAADYLRMWLLFHHGGIYLDADIEVIDPGCFEQLVQLLEKDEGLQLLCEREANGFIANSFILAKPGCLILKQFMDRVAAEHGVDMEVWNCGMGAWTDYLHGLGLIPGWEFFQSQDHSVRIFEPHSYFGKSLNHHFLRSWEKLEFPKHITTIWLTESSIPIDIAGWINSHVVPGWKHTLVTMDNYPKGIPYVEKALKEKKWVKACDYLRGVYLNQYGGIYLDADIEIINPEVLDRITAEMQPIGPATVLCERNELNWLCSAFIATFPKHPLLTTYLKNILGNTQHYPDIRDEIWMLGMGTWTELLDVVQYEDPTIKIIPDGTYLNDRWLKHHLLNSWVPYEYKQKCKV